MKKKTAFGMAMVAIAAAAAPVRAADMPIGPGPYSAAPMPSSTYNWLGPYLGVNLGYQWGSVTNSSADPGGITGGIQGGYNWQNGPFVYGVEADFQGSGAEDTFAAYKFSNPWFGTFRGRAGYALNNILFYGTLGFAYGRGRVEIAGLSETHLHPGWVAGGGLEVGLTPNWSAKAEYLFVDLSDESFALTGLSHGFRSNLMRLGVNYRF
jgi:outer membrane immunogenic protein